LSLESRRSALDDPGAELLDKAQGLWDRYGRIALGALVAIAVIGIGTYYVLSGRRTRENAASEKLAEANSLFWRADYDRSRQVAQDVAKNFGGTPSGTDALRISGDDAYWRGNWKEAIADYNAYLSKNGSGLIADGVRRSEAYAEESVGQYADASALYDKLVGAFDRNSSGEMLFASARCQVALGHKDEALKRYQRIIDEFPDSGYQLQARIQIGKLSPVTLN